MLLPTTGLLRRMDLVEVIGQALLARVGQASARRIAGELGVPLSTVRGWLGRMAQPEHAERVRAHFTRLALWLDPRADPPGPRGSPLADAVEAIGVAAVVAARRLGPASADPWRLAAGATGGRLLAPLASVGCNTSALFAAGW